MVDFSEKQKRLWDTCEIRFLVVFSLFLQIFLTFFAPLRKRKTTKWVRPCIWAAYLLADWVAAFALGILSNSIPGSPESSDSISTNSSSANELLAFWAPFLLVHLGGPDTITALALEDNQLWVRHLLALIVHLTGAIYVFVLTLPNNRLLTPTLFIFMAGIVRYIERTWALYLASSGGFRPSTPTLKEMAEKPEEATSGGNHPMPDLKSIDSIEKVRQAHKFLTTYTSLILDHPLRFHERQESRNYFFRLHPKDAFGIIEVELGLLFDMLHTKAPVIHTLKGYISRGVCFLLVLAALAIFIPFDKRGSHHVDKFITYALLVVAITVDIIAFLNLISSNWMVASSRNTSLRLLASKICAPVRPYGPPRRPAYMSQYNLISYCLPSSRALKKVAEWLPFNFIEQLAFTEVVAIPNEIKAFIFYDLRNKSKEATSLKYIEDMSEKRWNWAIDKDDPDQMPHRFFNLELEDSILLWHIATDICYHSTHCKSLHRDFSRLVSDYMHYLLVTHPTMVSSTEGIPRIKWQDVCKEAKKFIKTNQLKDEKDLCEKLLEEASLTEDTGPLRTETLRDACVVAKNLLSQPEILAWMNISRVWLELLSFAANQCSGKEHTQRLVKGGEFLTTVWLLMAQLGLAQQYRAEFSNPQADPVTESSNPQADPVTESSNPSSSRSGYRE